MIDKFIFKLMLHYKKKADRLEKQLIPRKQNGQFRKRVK